MYDADVTARTHHLQTVLDLISCITSGSDGICSPFQIGVWDVTASWCCRTQYWELPKVLRFTHSFCQRCGQLEPARAGCQ